MHVAEALTPLLRLSTFSWIVTSESHQKMSQFPTLVAAHQAEVCGPPVGRGPQVENCCINTSATFLWKVRKLHGVRMKSSTQQKVSQLVQNCKYLPEILTSTTGTIFTRDPKAV